MTLEMIRTDVRREASVADGRPAAGGLWRLAGAVLLVALAQAVVGLDLDVPVVRPVLALATFLGVPTMVLHRRAGFAADSGAARALYALGLSLLALVLGGLLLDTLLPLVGRDHPLAPAPLAVTWLVLDVALLAWRRSVPLLPAGALRAGGRRVVTARVEAAEALAVLALVLAVAGAVRLNNGAGGGVAILAEVVAAGALLVLLLGRPGSLGRDARVVGLVAAALLLATSLRGWTITGHDIQAEYLVFRLTNGAQDWQMSALPNAYNACLSVNILPTVLVQATGLPGLLVFKVLLQLVFAAVPVLTLLFARRFVTRRLAVVAAVLTVAFPTFFTDMPYLVRQEIAFFFLGLVLLAATEPARTRVGTRLLVLALGVGVVLSHYSTTYVLLMALVAALVGVALSGVVRRLRHRTATSHPPLVLLHPLVVAALVAMTLAWAGPVTHTGGHAQSVVRETVDAVTGHGAAGPGSSDTSYWVLSGDRTSARERMDLFVRETLAYRDSEIPPADRVVADPGPAELRPALHPQATAPLTTIGRAVDAMGVDPVHLDNAAKLGCAVLMQLLTLLGLVWLLRSRLRTGRLALPGDGVDDAGSYPGARGDGPGHEVVCLTWGAMAALALIVLVPNLSVDYGVLRAFQQTLLVIAPVMAMGLWLALRPLARRAPSVASGLLGLVPVLLALVLTGVLPAALGGQQQRIALASAGTYYDRFYVSDSEDAALGWLGAVDHADTTNTRIIASRNVNVRLLALSDNRAPVSDRLYPTLLSDDAYVFVDGQVLDQGVSTVFYTGDLLTYTYPLADLDQRLDLVYSAPQARIYR